MAEPLVWSEAKEPGVVILTLNRPQKRNALSMALMESLCRAMVAAEADVSRRVVILRGAGPVFCAGLDLREAADDDTAERSAHLVAQTLRTIHRSRLVSIAAVHGAALAGGAGVMTACDLVVAADGTHIGYPETFRGLVAGLVMSFLVRQIGDRRARELLLLGESIGARRAADIGLVNRVVEAGRLLDTAVALATQVMMGGPQAVARIKELLNELAPRDLDGDLHLALRHHLAARASDEAKEGLAAFLEKRAPAWQQDLSDVKP